jgi:hypothetical protein
MSSVPTRAEEDAKNFLRYAFGETPVGSAENESVDRAYSPELKAFFQGRLGPVPAVWYRLVKVSPAETTARKNLADFLRELADTIEPETSQAEQ